MTTKKTSLLPGYSSSIIYINGKKRYNSKIDVICGIDPYEIPENEWQDNIDLWPCRTHIHVGMYLLLTPSVYSNEDLLNYIFFNATQLWLSFSESRYLYSYTTQTN